VASEEKIGVSFHAADRVYCALDYIRMQCDILKHVSIYTKDKIHPECPFIAFFEKSPAVQQLHYNNP
jgi:hypothetical protein